MLNIRWRTGWTCVIQGLDNLSLGQDENISLLYEPIQIIKYIKKIIIFLFDNLTTKGEY